MAMTFGSFVSREDASHIEGAIAPQQVEIINTQLSDAVSDGNAIQQEIVEMENAEQVIQQMEQVASDNAVNIAAAEGQPAPENIVDSAGEVVAPVNPESQPVIDQNSTPEEVNNVAAQTVATVESLMGNLKFNHKKYSNITGVKSMPSCESLVRNRYNGLLNLKITQEALGDTIKDLYNKAKDFIKRIIEKIREWLAKYIPFFKNIREKGDALVKKASEIKRPELKNPDKDFEPSDRFIVVKFVVKDLGLMANASKTIGSAMVDAISNRKTAKETWDALKGNANIKASKILESLDKANCKIVGVTESNNQYELNEIAMGTMGDNLTFPGLILSDSGKAGEDDYNYRSEFTVKTLRVSVDKKDAKTKFKLTAKEFQDFAKLMGERAKDSWRLKDEIEKLNDELKKAANALDKHHADEKNKDDDKKKTSQSDLCTAARTVMTAIMGVSTYPQLLLKVGNEAVDQIKDGDKD